MHRIINYALHLIRICLTYPIEFINVREIKLRMSETLLVSEHTQKSKISDALVRRRCFAMSEMLISEHLENSSGIFSASDFFEHPKNKGLYKPHLLRLQELMFLTVLRNP